MNFIIGIMCIIGTCTNVKVEKPKEPCDTDFSLLKPETQIKLGMACSTVEGKHVIRSSYRRKEILESDKGI